MRRLLMTSAMCWAACSKGPPLDPQDLTATSGSRLIAERWTSADGTSTFAGWYDRELDMRCRWAMAGDGRWRCLPSEARQTGFANSQCSQLAIASSAACASVKFATGVTAGGAEVYRIGARLSTVYFFDGGCRASSGLDGAVHHAAGEAVPLDRFVAAAQVTRGETIGQIELRGEDGSRELVPLHDARGLAKTMGYACALRLTGPDSAVCMPTEATARAWQPLYLDAACTQPAMYPLSTADVATVLYASRPCAVPALYELGAPTTVSNVYLRAENGECTSRGGTSAQVIPLTERAGALVPLSLAIADGTARLRHTTWISPAGEQWPGPLFDSDRGVLCVVQPEAGGTGARCVPALNDTFSVDVLASTSSACDSETRYPAACWGQSIRPHTRPFSACGFDGVEYLGAQGPVITDALHVGVSQPAFSECATIDQTGLEVREGEYTRTDPTELARLQLVRDDG